jgi:hypothetical protein
VKSQGEAVKEKKEERIKQKQKKNLNRKEDRLPIFKDAIVMGSSINSQPMLT